MADSARKHMVLGTAGHIDHGKSSLIKALTGVDPDRLVEEKRRGITIELGFAELTLPDGSHMGVVDVPGHERFVRQMIAGATGIDMALLCIAADDGIMPQTHEHIAVLEVLGIRRCVVALTKCDLVDADWLEFIRGEIAGFLESTPFVGAPIVAVSARSGEGLDDLRHTIVEVAREIQEDETSSTVRYPIDRVFSIKGSGTVVTGTLWSGTVVVGDELELLPQGERLRVRSVQVHGEQVERATAGNRVAINLNAVKTDEVCPGDFLASPGAIKCTDRLDAWISYLDTGGSGKPLVSGMRLRIAHGTREILGRLLLMNDKETLAPGESCFAQLRLDKVLPLSRADRFVLRLYSPVRVVGGGMVLQVVPKRRTCLQTGEQELLEALRDGAVAQAIRQAVTLQVAPVNAGELAAKLDVGSEPVIEVLEAMRREGKLVQLPMGSEGKAVGSVAAAATAHYASRSVLQKSLAAIEKTLLAFHSNNPTSTSIAWPALQKQTEAQGLKKMSGNAFQALLKAAVRDEIAVIGAEGVSHAKAGAGAQEARDKAAEALYNILAEAGQNPPNTTELITSAGLDTSLAHRALGTLEKAGRIRRINKDLCFEERALAKMEQSLRDHLAKHGSASVADLKEAMNTSRKYAVPLLEYFDNKGLTRRTGDLRSLIG